MSFSSELKESLSKISNLKNKELVKFELIGYLISNNTTSDKKNIYYSTINEYNINRFNKLISNMEILNFKNNSGMCRTILEEDWAVMGKVQLVRKSTKIGQIMLRKRQKPYIYIDKNLEIETEF